MKKAFLVVLICSLTILLTSTVWAIDNYEELKEIIIRQANDKGLVVWTACKDIYEIVIDDFNFDGKTDIAALLSNASETRQEYDPVEDEYFEITIYEDAILWIGTFQDDEFQILYEWALDVKYPDSYSDDDKSFVASLHSANDGQFTLQLNGGYHVFWSNKINLKWDYYQLRTVTAENWSTWKFNNAAGEEIEIDYRTMKARYCYKRCLSRKPERFAYPLLKSAWDDIMIKPESIFYRFLPGQAQEIHIDGIDSEPDWATTDWITIENDEEMITYGKNNWTGSEDLSFRAKTLLQGNILYLFIEIKDDQIIFNDTTDLKQDHLEIWLDSKVSLVDHQNADLADDPEDLLYRHTRQGLYQFGIFKSGILRFLPKTRKEDFAYKFIKTDIGYNVEMALPLDSYLEEPLANYQRIGFTIVVSDTDHSTQPAQDSLIATSQLRWGNPYSLGDIVFNLPSVPAIYWHHNIRLLDPYNLLQNSSHM